MAYFLPIKSTSLVHYFSCACIKPAKFFENKIEDIQDKFQNALLISTALCAIDTDCCMELVLTDTEIRRLKQCAEGFYLLSTPLPISRIKKVYFRDQSQLKQTLTNINLSSAFIPDSLASVAIFSEVKFDSIQRGEDTGSKDYSKDIDLYDRILGALALMKIAKEPYMNYSENYASTLSFFNNAIKDELKRQDRQITDKFHGLFSRTGSFAKNLPYLEKIITKEDLDQIAADNGQSIERSFTNVVSFDKLRGITYAFAILQSYGVGDEAATQKIDSLIINNFKGIKDGMAEGIALYYGYNRGYKVFNNCYSTVESEKQYVKFLMDSQLDYYTIESVYQYVFNTNTASSRFPYIDEWCPKNVRRPRRTTDYLILDTVFVGKKKPSVFSKEYSQSFWEEIKKFDFFNCSIASLIDLIRNKIARDAQEEFTYEAETEFAKTESKLSHKLSVANEEIESLKQDQASQYAYIKELQTLNDSLHKEIESLKNTINSTITSTENDVNSSSQVIVESAPIVVEKIIKSSTRPKAQPNKSKAEATNKKTASTTANRQKRSTTSKTDSKVESESQSSKKVKKSKPSSVEEGTLQLQFEADE